MGIRHVGQAPAAKVVRPFLETLSARIDDRTGTARRAEPAAHLRLRGLAMLDLRRECLQIEIAADVDGAAADEERDEQQDGNRFTHASSDEQEDPFSARRKGALEFS